MARKPPPTPHHDDTTLLVAVAPEADGYTYSLTPESARWLADHFPTAKPADRIFIAQDKSDDFAAVHERLAPRLLPLLTGLEEEELARLGPISFCEPYPQRVLFTWRAAESSAGSRSGTPGTKPATP